MVKLKMSSLYLLMSNNYLSVYLDLNSSQSFGQMAPNFLGICGHPKDALPSFFLPKEAPLVGKEFNFSIK